MDPKPRPNHATYLEAIRRMTPQERLAKVLELSDLSRRMFESGLRRAFPNLDEVAFRALLHRRLDQCRNTNY